VIVGIALAIFMSDDPGDLARPEDIIHVPQPPDPDPRPARPPGRWQTMTGRGQHGRSMVPAGRQPTPTPSPSVPTTIVGREHLSAMTRRGSLTPSPNSSTPPAPPVPSTPPRSSGTPPPSPPVSRTPPSTASGTPPAPAATPPLSSSPSLVTPGGAPYDPSLRTSFRGGGLAIVINYVGDVLTEFVGGALRLDMEARARHSDVLRMTQEDWAALRRERIEREVEQAPPLAEGAMESAAERCPQGCIEAR